MSELKIMLENIDNKMTDAFKINGDQHLEITEHLKITNGRVRKLEQWKYMVIGGLVFTNVLVLPIFLMLISKYIQQI